MKDVFPGSGGKDSGAAMRIQFEYDILSKNIVDLSITAFNRQDAKDSTETIDLIQMGDLVIRDLGYMHICVLSDILVLKTADMKAYLKSLIATMQKNRLEVKKGDKFCMDVIASSITIEKPMV